MKTILTSVIVLILALMQWNIAGAQLSIGVKGGVFFPDASFQIQQEPVLPVEKINFIGSSFAIPVEIGIITYLSIQTELSFNQKRSLFAIKNLDSYTAHTYTINYLEWPLMIKLSFRYKNLNFYGLGGPFAGLALNSTSQYPPTFALPNYIADRLNYLLTRNTRWEFGLWLGGGIEKFIDKERKIFIDGRYVIGFTDIDGSEEAIVKSRGTMITIGLLMPVKSFF